MVSTAANALDSGAQDIERDTSITTEEGAPGYEAALVSSWQREDYYSGLSSPPELLATSVNRFAPGDEPTWYPIPQKMFPIGERDKVVEPYEAARQGICRAIETILPEVNTIMLLKLGETADTARTALWLSTPPDAITQRRAEQAIPQIRSALAALHLDELLVVEVVAGTTSTSGLPLQEADLLGLPVDLVRELDPLFSPPGIQIVPEHCLTAAGSGGLLIAAGPADQRKTFMLTCGHVASGGDNASDKEEWTSAGPCHAVFALSNGECQELITTLRVELNARAQHAENLAIGAMTDTSLEKPAQAAEFVRQQWEQTLQETESHFQHLEQRRLGHIAWKPPVVYSDDDYPQDIALVQLDLSTWSGLEVNTIAWAGGKAGANQRAARTVDPGMHITSPIVANGYVPRNEVHHGRYIVKRGASTGVTFGAVSAVDALWQVPEGGWARFVIAVSPPTDRPFSQGGDSGASAFDKDGRWFGTITAGYRGPWNSNKSDVSFLVPAWHIMARLEREGFQNPQVIEGGKLSS